MFTRWCHTQGIHPHKASSPELAEFFLWLYHHKGLKPITIKGYRAMLSDTYKHIGRGDLGSDRDISDLLSNLTLSRPASRTLFPGWNLPWVLTYLNSEKFEPLGLAPMRELTLKTCFLLALATASRVSELHALSASADYLQFRSDGSVTLITRPGFVAKNRLPSVPPSPMVVQRLPAQNAQEHLQDPVRALKKYIRRTKQKRTPDSRLFLPLVDNKPDISAQTISSWIKAVIREAYAELVPASRSLLRIRAHEVRAISTSLAFERSVSAADIMSAVGWRSPSTFAKFYLREMRPAREALELVGQIAVPSSGAGRIARESGGQSIA